MSDAQFLLGVVRARRSSAGCSDASATASGCDDIEFLLPRADAAGAGDALVSPPVSPSSASTSVPLRSPLATPDELLACAPMLIASLGNAASTGGANARSIYLNDNGYSDEDDDNDDDEEEEIFNREVDAIGFRNLNLGHEDDTNTSNSAATRSVTSPATAKRLLGAAGDEIGIFFHLPAAHAKALSVMGIAVPDPRSKRAYFVQQYVRFLVLLTNVPFHAHVRTKLQGLAAQFFRDDEPLDSFDALTAFYRSLTTAPSAFAELPYRELFIGLPVVPLVRRLGADVLAVLRVLLLEGRIVCYSSNASLASSAPLALLALLPGVLSASSCDFTSRTIQAVVYRLRRFGMPLSLFNEDFVLQPCFTSDQAARVYATKGFLVGTSDPLLLKHPSASVDVVVNLDLRQVVAFPTKKTEHAFAVGAATTAFAESLAERLGRSSGGSSLSFARVSGSKGGSRTRSMRQSMRDIKTRTLTQLPPLRGANTGIETAISVVAAPMQAAHADVDWVLVQFQTYFEHMLDDAFTSLVASASGGDDTTDEPYHPSIRALLEDLAKPLFGDHAKFVAEYGRGWTHAWQTTSNYDNWLSAHRLERRRSSIAAPLAPPPQDGHAKYTYPNGDEYDGCFRNGKRHGFGVYTEFVTKHQYEGDWVDDMRHGNGILSSKHHGYIYDGEWEHDMRSGRGHSSLKNAESYTGEWRDNCFHGSGIYMNASGDLYDGEWRHGVKDGVGKLTVARPKPSDEFGGLTQYRGEWRRGKFHGTGTAVYLDASEYSGTFEDGKRHGNGTLTFANGDRYEGQWWKGYRHGEGAMYSAKSGATREGTWKKDVDVDGVWFIVYANGDKYTGECRRGRPWGEGICKYANQSSYSGGWVDGLREGFGVCINADGSILEGEWKNSVYVKPVRAPSKFVDVPLSTSSSTGSFSRSQSTTSDRRRQLSVFSQQHPESGSHEHVYPNGDTYDGEFKRGMRHGFGVFTERASGNVYEGEWRENVRHGSGVLTSGMKDFIYDGAWEHDVRSGHGHCVIRGCETYSGQWKQNQFHGLGTYIDAEGHVYEGEFAHGKKHGVGKQVVATLPEKEQYSGEWKFGARDGVGDAVFADGSTYSGSWRADVRDGEGTFIAAGSSGDKYVGQWRNGMRDGAGILYVGSTGVVKEGVWSQDEPMDGEWTIQFPDGSKFTGACVKSRPHGRGVCKYANGDLYDGEWVHGKRHGVGTGFFANGESFVGEWENNHVALNGRGKLTLADGTVHVYAK